MRRERPAEEQAGHVRKVQSLFCFFPKDGVTISAGKKARRQEGKKGRREEGKKDRY